MSSRRQIVWIAVLAILVCLPFFRYVAWLGDEGILLHAARRMTNGEHIYRDFFEFMQPLGFLIAFAWLKLFGGGFFGIRVLAIGTIVIAATVAFTASRSVSRSPFAAGALILAWLIGSQGNWTVVGHRWFTLAFSIGAAALVLSALDRPRSTGHIFAAGICVGAAVVTTAPPGGMVAIACLVSLLVGKRPRAELGALIAGSLVVPALTAGWMVWDGVLDAALRSALDFLAHRYAGVQRVGFGRDWDRQSYLVVLAFPLAALALIGSWSQLDSPKPRAALAFALAGFAGCFPRPDVAHIAFAVPLACPFLAWSLPRAASKISSKLLPAGFVLSKLLPAGFVPSKLLPAGFVPSRLLPALAVTLLLLPSLDGWAGRAVDVSGYPPVEVAVGTIRLGSGTDPDQLGPLFREISALPAGDAFFFYPYEPLFIYLTGRRHAAPVELFTPNYTWPSQYRQSCESVIREAAWVVIDRPQAQAEELKKSWPQIRDVNPPEKVAFERALEASYPLVRRTPRYELRRRATNASVEVCRTIPVEGTP